MWFKLVSEVILSVCFIWSKEESASTSGLSSGNQDDFYLQLIVLQNKQDLSEFCLCYFTKKICFIVHLQNCIEINTDILISVKICFGKYCWPIILKDSEQTDALSGSFSEIQQSICPAYSTSCFLYLLHHSIFCFEHFLEAGEICSYLD